ncbi:S-adenosyl-L-methionine-dependent methyltransferase [Bombardia bombarda]|uniref:S-adenosyl-L-methionine-dependent methyltransferase n=1 Tax=Bombardia bombarda TaxID=252184 RepID=A0AA40C8J9_9PEZI|nr:S-adenosyl-L-methionine-dependent methyltransferase [Bombardia bombarda]
MGKLSSWLSLSSSSGATAEQKKENRRSFSPFSSSPLAKPKLAETSDDEAKPAVPSSDVAKEPTAAAGQSPSRITVLAQIIAKETEKVETYMRGNNLPMPSFEVDAPGDFPRLPEEINRSRQEIISASKELGLLAQGPRESIRWGLWSFIDVLALTILNHFEIAKLFPVDSTITLAELQTKTSLDAINLARLIRVAITNGIFREPSPNVIAHTAGSRLLAEDGDLQAWVGFNCEDVFPAAGHVLQSLKAHPEATALMRSGFCFAFDTVDKEPMFVTFGKDPARARRMGRAMVSLTGGEGYEVSHLSNVEGGGYDFGELDAKGGTFVDVGGSHGFVCVDLAKKYKNVKFVVQDLPKTVESAPSPICDDAEVAERITLLPHDFFTEQVTKDADVYFFRWIMHNYSTPYAIKILQNMIPALKPGARILINENCLQEPGLENPWDESLMRRMDVTMLTLLNSQERTEEEFKSLFKAAGDGFVFEGVRRPKGCRMSIVEAVWQPELKEVAAITEVDESSAGSVAAAAPA